MTIPADTFLIERMQRWVDNIVVGLNLCPFARSVVQRGLMNIVVLDANDWEISLQALADEALALANSTQQDATTLLVLANGVADFDDYLDYLAVAEDLLADLGHDGELQLASFHPRYCFEGVDADDPGNYTNRSPFPALHLLREASVTAAVDRHPDAQRIPHDNQARLRGLGTEQLRLLFDMDKTVHE